ncbi:hypothetical protein [Streptomyces uncialis]|uniref:Uncharacterized protein n=1 Tax=Streptomyces uncialis TaxID=1048205 RepID=A0A1Q4V0X3_9ACTN|nr:hypothetical protein [Streptomyces uncialis]OKH91461.1 hypothetical protein AB852_28270 [Streptomyces uncialis]
MKISLCKHLFPLTVGRDGVTPGDCRGCGLTWTDGQAELERQAERIRLATARDGNCEHCAKRVTVFQFQREQQSWDEAEPPLLWLCQHCWSRAAITVEQEEAAFADTFGQIGEGPLARLVGGLR